MFGTLLARYERLFDEYLCAHEAYRKTNTEFSAESKKMVKLLNQVVFQSEELRLQSKVEEIGSIEKGRKSYNLNCCR